MSLTSVPCGRRAAADEQINIKLNKQTAQRWRLLSKLKQLLTGINCSNIPTEGWQGANINLNRTTFFFIFIHRTQLPRNNAITIYTSLKNITV